MGETLKIGREKVPTDVGDVDDRSLAWYAESCRSTQLQDIAKREIARRKSVGQQQNPGSCNGAKATPQAVEVLQAGSTFSDGAKATLALETLTTCANLLTPATQCPVIPDGHAITLRMMWIHPDDPELYPPGNGKLALSKSHIRELANLAGVSILDSRRTSDARHAHLVAWHSVAQMRLFDGSTILRPGDVEVDLRAPEQGLPSGGIGYEAIASQAKSRAEAARAKGKNARDVEWAGDFSRELEQARKFIIGSAQSKSENRAISNLGIRRAYTRAELQKPFVVAALIMTGEFRDPIAREMYHRAAIGSFFGASSRVYGHGEQQLPPQDQSPPAYLPPSSPAAAGDDDIPF